MERIPVRDYEEGEPAAAFTQLVPQTERALSTILECLESLLRHYDHMLPPPLSTSSNDPADSAEFIIDLDRIMAEEKAGTKVADLCFLAQIELGRKRRLLRKIDTETEQFHILYLCASSLRKANKAIKAVENCLGSQEGLEPRLSFVTELEISLKVRLAYRRFRQATLGDAPANPEDVADRLRTVCTAIAKLRGRDLYLQLRFDDRRELLGLQQRILSWSSDADGGDAETGLRLWQDAAMLAHLLARVNHRSELLEHDVGLIAEALDLISDGAETPLLADKLTPLLGRDDELDQLVESSQAADLDAWQETLTRLQRGLGSNAQMPAASAA